MKESRSRPARPSAVLKNSRLSPKSKEISWVLRDVKRQQDSRLRIAKADLEITSNSGRERARLAQAAGVPLVATGLTDRASARPTAQLSERSLKRDLAELHSAMVPDAKQQHDRISAIKRHPEIFNTTIGDPIISGYMAWTDSVTAAVSPTAIEGHLDLLPPNPVVENNVPFINTVRFAAVASSPIGYQAELAWLTVDTAQVFSFESWVTGSCSLVGWFLPNAVFRLLAPDAVWFFPFWHAVPHARLRFSMNLRVDHFLPGSRPGDVPLQTNEVWAMPLIELSGWGGAKSNSGSIRDTSPAFLSTPPFVVVNGSRVVISAQYHVDIFVMEGGSATFDAISSPSPTMGLNVSHVEVFLNY
jgi:hypothetical protein